MAIRRQAAMLAVLFISACSAGASDDGTIESAAAAAAADAASVDGAQASASATGALAA